MLRPSSPRRPLTRADKDRIVVNLEERIARNPLDEEAATRLIAILDHDSPAVGDNNAYTQCQRKLAHSTENDTSLEPLVDVENFAENYRQWRHILDQHAVKPPIAVNQLFMGQIHRINDINTRCEVYLNLFAKTGAIPKICHDCFKVQILPFTVVALVQVFFALRVMRFKRDNSRKCMIEVRKDIAYPYKGYIYCETEEEVLDCHAAITEHLTRCGVNDVVCGISHGCSEYSQKHPDFKYSADGKHRSFERPQAWDKIEARYLGKPNEMAPTLREDLNRSGITLRDLVGLNTWFHYAYLIGDKSYEQVVEDPERFKVKSFARSIKDQVKSRRRELLELRTRNKPGV